ncbi:YkgJ family cysteine cluster protein [candidate division KSB1 bacterium]|nr:YkgJ family cysteine cluster protein [candidate division KSB1 bacterium]
MECRAGCGACCIAISISSPLPDMPNGKPAGVRCIHLSGDNFCSLYLNENRPDVCRNLKPSREMCGDTFEQALHFLTNLEQLTKPDM